MGRNIFLKLFGVIKMDIKQKNLIFQFVERVYSENTEDELYKKEMEL